MAVVEMVMPQMGESVMEGTVLSWLKQAGDTIEQDESVLEVATDKVDTEVPAPYSGVLKEILAQEGDVVQVGHPIARIETEEAVNEDELVSDGGGDAQPATETATATAPASTTTATAAPSNGQPAASQGSRFYSPLVMSMAREENIPMAELETIPGTGKEGRVTKKDMQAYLEQRQSGQTTSPTTEAPASQKKSAPAAAPTTGGNGASAKPAVSVSGNDEIIEMDRMRKMIADRMVESKRTSPHVTSFVEADVTGIVNWRNKHKRSFKEREGGALTFTPIFIEAVVKALQDYPMVNVSIDGNRIIKKKDINIGMAVALPSGNLIVPVIKGADQLNIKGLAHRVNDLARRARDNKLKPEELQGGTYSVSNVGTFGNVMGTPIIMQPQVGIMAFGAVQKKPAVIETPQGDLIGIRHMMFLSHSYDHRVVDGSLGGMFVRRVADYLEKFDANQTI